MKPRCTSVCTSCTRTVSPTSSPSNPLTTRPSANGRANRTQVPVSEAPVTLEDGQDAEVVTRDAIDDSIGPQEGLADVLAPELGHHAPAAWVRRRELRLLYQAP